MVTSTWETIIKKKHYQENIILNAYWGTKILAMQFLSWREKRINVI